MKKTGKLLSWRGNNYISVNYITVLKNKELGTTEKKKKFETLGAPQEPFVILHHEKSRLDLPGAVGGANRRDFVGSRPW